MDEPFKAAGSWYVYMLRCADGTLYTGITTDVTRRVEEHNRGAGAKYTRCRTPVALLFVEETEDRSSASRREWTIKRLTRRGKLELIHAALEADERVWSELPKDLFRLEAV